MRRKIVAWSVLCALALVAFAGVSQADRSLRTVAKVRTPIRAYVGATPQQYDTMACVAGERIELVNFAMYMDDSAMTPTLNVTFMSAISKTQYFHTTPTTFTANQNLTYVLPMAPGPIVFPNDSTILIYYNITGATPGSLDTLLSMTTYRIERY